VPNNPSTGQAAAISPLFAEGENKIMNNTSKKIGGLERILRSRVARGIFRIHMGLSLIRSWSKDVQVPQGTAIHLFDYLLYQKTNKDKPFKEWLKTRKLIDP
jgi:hypothetical protein